MIISGPCSFEMKACEVKPPYWKRTNYQLPTRTSTRCGYHKWTGVWKNHMRLPSPLLSKSLSDYSSSIFNWCVAILSIIFFSFISSLAHCITLKRQARHYIIYIIYMVIKTRGATREYSTTLSGTTKFIAVSMFHSVIRWIAVLHIVQILVNQDHWTLNKIRTSCVCVGFERCTNN